MKTMQYSKKHNTLHWSRNNLYLLFTYLSPVRQGRRLGTLFSQEKQTYPPSLSEHGILRSSKRKSSIIGCILPERFTSLNEDPNISKKEFNGAAINNMLVTTSCKNLLSYRNKVFIPYVRSQAVNMQRID